jgi:iron complex transport system substrate-binding protein
MNLSLAIERKRSSIRTGLLTIVGCLFFFITACNNSVKKNTPSKQVWIDLPNAYARCFVIQQTQAAQERLVILNPTKSGDTLRIVEQPLSPHHIACLSTTHLAILKSIGLADSICATGFGSLVKDEYFRQRLNEGKMMNLTTGEDISKEIFFTAKAESFLVYPFGHANYGIYEEMGIPCIPVCEYLEFHPLGRAEWAVALGWLFGKKEAGRAAFQAVSDKFKNIEHIASGITERPVVFSGSSNAGVWHAPPGNSFAGNLIEAAGAHYIFTDSISGGNLEIPEERFIALSNLIEWWGIVIDKKGEPNRSDFLTKDALAEHIPAMAKNQLFYCNTSECDYFGEAIMHPDEVLQDLISIFHPKLLPLHHPSYFKPLHNSKKK